MVLPHVLEDVGHLQPLAKGEGQPPQLLPSRRELRDPQTEKLGQHLAHHACHAITVAVQLRQGLQAAGAAFRLEARHTFRHHPHAAFDRRPLGGFEGVNDAHHARSVGDQVPFGVGRARRKARRQLRREGRGRLPTFDDAGKTAQESSLLLDWKAGVVFHRVGDAAQQVGIAHHDPQPVRQRRNGQGEGARDAREDAVLVLEVGGFDRHAGAGGSAEDPPGGSISSLVLGRTPAGRCRRPGERPMNKPHSRLSPNHGRSLMPTQLPGSAAAIHSQP